MAKNMLYLLAFLDAQSSALILPLINPNVIALGGSLSVVGILTSLTSGATLFSSPVVGSWSDTRGRKLLLFSTLTMILVANAVAGIPSLSLFFISRILYGTAHHTDTLIKVLITDTVPKVELNKSFNKMMAIAGSAFIIAPVVGGILFEMFQSFAAISIILCVLDITAIGITYFFIEESSTKKEEANNIDDNHKKSFLQSLSDDLTKVFTDLKNVNWSKYGSLLALKFLLEAGFSLFFASFGLILMQKFLFTRTQLGLSISYISIVMIASNILGPFFINKVYGKDAAGFQRILHGFIALLTLFTANIFAHTSVLYLGLLIPIFFFKQVMDSTWMEVLAKKTTEKDKGVMMGAATSMLSLSGLVCPLIGGLVSDFFGITAVSVLSVIPSILGTGLVKRLKHHDTFAVNEKNE